MSHRLKSFEGGFVGTIMGAMKGDLCISLSGMV